ncbi:peptide ABC transporter substrate-binding protein [Caproiciproducens sp. NJN-50]|uniref:peptide ABC transporter substrate-binding protein n=1 Tax=Acutalibacteraceae TaxID=3082771 RepID=UPI000FFE2356|nr:MULTISPECIES: peptide ABC transporter substrate-binding protein [Acutalibacteraceae]QAT49174.1 peptide ABC transporter substrate-binding protein [Caproiciproducens sp. NJN-50]
MLFRKMIAVFLVFAVLPFVLTGCKSGRPSNADKTIAYGLTDEPKTLDPQIASDSSSIIAIQALFEGLARLDAKGNAVPGAAERWQANSDSTEFTFSLRSTAKWSDQKPVTADDFVYAFRRAVSPQTNSPVCSQMFCLKNARQINAGKLAPEKLGVSAADSHTLKVDLEYSYPDFPKLTANSVFMPCNQAFFESTSGRYGLDSSFVLGNGPFRIDGKYGWAHDQYLNLKRSSSYSGGQAPLPSNVNFRVNGEDTDLSDPVAALKNGTVDAVSVSHAQALEAQTDGCTIASFQDSTWGLCFNTSSDLMKNVNVRKAFLQALDRKKVLAHLPRDASAADAIFLPGTTLLGENYRKLAGSPFLLSQDAKAAQTLASGLSELGISGSGKMGSVNVLCPDDENVKLMLNEMIISWNTQFHNYFNLEAMDESSLLSKVESGNYVAALYPVRPDGDGPAQVLSLFRSKDKGNFTGYSNAAYDSLLAKAENGTGTEAATDYAAAEEYLNRQAVFYPLYYGKRYYAMAKGVSGISFHPYQGGVDFINAGKE